MKRPPPLALNWTPPPQKLGSRRRTPQKPQRPRSTQSASRKRKKRRRPGPKSLPIAQQRAPCHSPFQLPLPLPSQRRARSNQEEKWSEERELTNLLTVSHFLKRKKRFYTCRILNSSQAFLKKKNLHHPPTNHPHLALCISAAYSAAYILSASNANSG